MPNNNITKERVMRPAYVLVTLEPDGPVTLHLYFGEPAISVGDVAVFLDVAGGAGRADRGQVVKVVDCPSMHGPTDDREISYRMTPEDIRHEAAVALIEARWKRSTRRAQMDDCDRAAYEAALAQRRREEVERGS